MGLLGWMPIMVGERWGVGKNSEKQGHSHLVCTLLWPLHKKADPRWTEPLLSKSMNSSQGLLRFPAHLSMSLSYSVFFAECTTILLRFANN